MKKQHFTPIPLVVKNEPKTFVSSYEEMVSNDFDSRSEGELDIICNMISVLPVEYDRVTEVTEEEDGFSEEMVTYKPLCYYVMHDGLVNKYKVVFERPDMSL